MAGTRSRQPVAEIGKRIRQNSPNLGVLKMQVLCFNCFATARGQGKLAYVFLITMYLSPFIDRTLCNYLPTYLPICSFHRRSWHTRTPALSPMHASIRKVVKKISVRYLAIKPCVETGISFCWRLTQIHVLLFSGRSTVATRARAALQAAFASGNTKHVVIKYIVSKLLIRSHVWTESIVMPM